MVTVLFAPGLAALTLFSRIRGDKSLTQNGEVCLWVIGGLIVSVVLGSVAALPAVPVWLAMER